MPVDTCYPSDLGWGVRQTTSRSKHSDFGFTWIIGRGGLRCEVWIPLQKYKARGGQCHVTEFEKYENAHQFFDLLKESKATDSEVLDLNQLWVVLSAVLDRFFWSARQEQHSSGHRLWEGNSQKCLAHGAIFGFQDFLESYRKIRSSDLFIL